MVTGLNTLLRANAGVAERLIVEITESAAIHDIDETRGFVARVKDLGCRIAIDDFGAGYTSFRNLRKLGVDIVKIDGAFVENIVRSEDDRAFVRTLIDLAKRLRLATVAEWVQDEAAAKLFRSGAAITCKALSSASHHSSGRGARRSLKRCEREVAPSTHSTSAGKSSSKTRTDNEPFLTHATCGPRSRCKRTRAVFSATEIGEACIALDQ